MGHLENHGRLMKEFHSGKFLLSFDGKLDLYVKRYIFVTVHWQYPAKRVAVNSNEVVLMSSRLTKNLLDKYRSI